MIRKGTKVKNPNAKSNKSANRVGKVLRSYYFEVEGEIIRFAWVKFRDYEAGFAKSILKRA